MIIPLITTNNPPAGKTAIEQWQSALTANARPWCLFGSLAIQCRQPVGESLYPVIRALGRQTELELELHATDTTLALECLNQGASKVIYEEDCGSNASPVPTERQLVLTSNLSERAEPRRRVRIECPTVEQVSRCWSDQVPIQIQTEWLEAQPEFMATALANCLKSDRPDGLWPTLVVDQMNTALGLAYSNRESLLASIRTRKATYWSRSRNKLWEKGKTSGARQSLISIRIDCDSDCLRFEVDQRPPGFCHRGSYSCFGEEKTIQAVCYRLRERLVGDDTDSFTKKLANDPQLLQTKLIEEARELAEAHTRDEIVWEAADVLFFSLVKLAGQNIGLDEVYGELARRMQRVERRQNKIENENQAENRN